MNEEANSELVFDNEFPRDGSIIKQIRKELKNDFEYNSSITA